MSIMINNTKIYLFDFKVFYGNLTETRRLEQCNLSWKDVFNLVEEAKRIGAKTK